MRIAAGSAEAEQNYDRLLARMTNADIWSLDARVHEVLSELGLENVIGSDCERDVATLSPGQRSKLNLAATIIAKPRVLVMDEPTNHLDANTISFLTSTVRDWDGTVLMASHDRSFIENTATVIYDMDMHAWNEVANASGKGKVTGLYRCAGAYSDYLHEKAQVRRQHAELHAAQQSEKRRLREHRQSSKAISHGGVRLAHAKGKAKKFFSDRAAATAERRIRADDRQSEALMSHEVHKPRDNAMSYTWEDPTEHCGIAASARDAAVKTG